MTCICGRTGTSDTIVSRVNRGWIGKAGVLAMGLPEGFDSSLTRTGRCQLARLDWERGPGAIPRVSPRFGSMRLLDRETHARSSVVALRRGQGRRRARAAPVGHRVLLEGPARAGSAVRRVDARRHDGRVDELCRRTPSSDHRGSIRTGARTTAPHSSPLAAPSRISPRTNFHCFPRDYPIQPRFRSLGADEVSGGCVRVDAARGSERKGTRSPSNRRDARRGF